MFSYGEIERVVHDQLEPPADYIRWSIVTGRLGIQAESIVSFGRKLDDDKIDLAQTILEQAEKAAEKKIKSKKTKLEKSSKK